MYIDTCFTAEALVRLMVDLYDKSPEMMDHNRDKEEPRFSDVVAIFKLLSSQLIEVRNLLEVLIPVIIAKTILEDNSSLLFIDSSRI